MLQKPSALLLTGKEHQTVHLAFPYILVVLHERFQISIGNHSFQFCQHVLLGMSRHTDKTPGYCWHYERVAEISSRLALHLILIIEGSRGLFGESTEDKGTYAHALQAPADFPPILQRQAALK